MPEKRRVVDMLVVDRNVAHNYSSGHRESVATNMDYSERAYSLVVGAGIVIEERMENNAAQVIRCIQDLLSMMTPDSGSGEDRKVFATEALLQEICLRCQSDGSVLATSSLDPLKKPRLHREAKNMTLGGTAAFLLSFDEPETATEAMAGRAASRFAQAQHVPHLASAA
jgi:hypothetical protein